MEHDLSIQNLMDDILKRKKPHDLFLVGKCKLKVSRLSQRYELLFFKRIVCGLHTVARCTGKCRNRWVNFLEMDRAFEEEITTDRFEKEGGNLSGGKGTSNWKIYYLAVFTLGVVAGTAEGELGVESGMYANSCAWRAPHAIHLSPVKLCDGWRWMVGFASRTVVRDVVDGVRRECDGRPERGEVVSLRQCDPELASSRSIPGSLSYPPTLTTSISGTSFFLCFSLASSDPS